MNEGQQRREEPGIRGIVFHGVNSVKLPVDMHHFNLELSVLSSQSDSLC